MVLTVLLIARTSSMVGMVGDDQCGIAFAIVTSS